MQAIGERLREARMRQGLDITELEAATKIRAKYLRALENDEFSMLPGSTYVKSFLRTYAEHLGLDAHLLLEEYRAAHEPRGEGEMALIPPAGRAPDLRDRRPGGPPSPILLIAGGVLLVLVVLAVIGLASGSGGKKSGQPRASAQKHAKKKASNGSAKKHVAAAPRSLKLKVVPSETTYVCVDNGKGTKLFEGTISTSQTFHGRRLRVNLGRSSASVYLNGRRVKIAQTSSAVGLGFSRSGKAVLLPPGQRPCA